METSPKEFVPEILFNQFFTNVSLRHSYLNYLNILEDEIKNNLGEAKDWPEALRLQGERAAIRKMRDQFTNHFNQHARTPPGKPPQGDSL